MSYAAGAATGGEDRKPKRAFREVENHRGEAGHRAECHADQDDGEVLEGERNGREGKRKRDVGAGGYERGRADDQEGFACKGFLKRSGTVGEADLGRDSGLHRAVLSRLEAI